MSSDTNLNGDASIVAIDRALTDLRRGRVVHVQAGAGDALVAAIETAPAALLEQLQRRFPGAVHLALTASRAQVVGVAAGDAPVLLAVPPGAPLAALRTLAGAEGVAAPPGGSLGDGAPWGPPGASDEASAAALLLAKLARLLPAVLTVPGAQPGKQDAVLQVRQADLLRFAEPHARDLERVSEALVPLAKAESSRLVLFRDARDGAEHVAVIVGEPDRAQPVTVRMHSSCLTGDLLGSLRCDCGDQLRRAMSQLAARGGVLLYLSQEGRGIGLANKLRAYQLQDTGLDTIDADQHLGFLADERTYAVAATMLRRLGVARVRLLTNNPHKVRALREAGIDVVAQQPLAGALNRHNARYIRAKRERAGHLAAESEED